ncbi:hypothetical protein [Candidatus Borrarchaeum sp.]|nr:hypothetical protein [Candidatus Borrarchaeum sp.]
MEELEIKDIIRYSVIFVSYFLVTATFFLNIVPTTTQWKLT